MHPWHFLSFVLAKLDICKNMICVLRNYSSTPTYHNEAHFLRNIGGCVCFQETTRTYVKKVDADAHFCIYVHYHTNLILEYWRKMLNTRSHTELTQLLMLLIWFLGRIRSTLKWNESVPHTTHASRNSSETDFQISGVRKLKLNGMFCLQLCQGIAIRNRSIQVWQHFQQHLYPD